MKEKRETKSLIDYYDDYAEAWAEKWYGDDQLMPYLRRFLAYLPASPKVLDLCCGAGYESMRMQGLGADVVGIDLSSKSILIAREKNPEIIFHVRDMLESYKDIGEFDGIACIAGLVHIDESNLEVAFKNMHEVLKVGGYLFVVVRDGDEITQSVTVDGTEYARRFFCYTLDKLKQHAQSYFEFIEEMKSETKWRYYLFKRN
ncbi:MAG: methyltransferase domain-containing protein [Clostridia bacterium]|nr:methyltransferase domain-containing protein [Clostridia bacterium]